MDSIYNEAFSSLLIFGLKALIIVFSILICTLIPIFAIRKSTPRDKDKKSLKLENLKKEYNNYIRDFYQKTMGKKDFKRYLKGFYKKEEKEDSPKSSLFVLSFKGDIMASQVKNLRDEVSFILEVAKPKDEVAVLLESRGGSVSHYGLAANQLERLRQNNIPLTVCVDKVAGSGGYLMACVGNQILSSPFAFIGSIGVMFGIPNVHDFLKKHDVSYQEFTAGKFKRTVTPFGKITEEKKAQLQSQLNLIHDQFKNFVRRYREIDLEETATGEAWLAEEALKKGLVDKLQCSDDYILEQMKNRNVYKVSLKSPQSFLERILNKKSVSEESLSPIFSKDFII